MPSNGQTDVQTEQPRWLLIALTGWLAMVALFYAEAMLHARAAWFATLYRLIRGR
jgi:hypothetical protein